MQALERGAPARALVHTLAGLCCVLAVGCADRAVVPDSAADAVIELPDIAFARASFVRGTQGEQIVVHDLDTGLARGYFSAPLTGTESGSTWVSAPVGPAAVTLETLSAIRDATGRLHMVALDRTYADLYYGVGPSDAVVWRNVYPGYDVVSAVAPIVLDELGSAWVFFANQTSATVEALHFLADTTAVRTVVAQGATAALAGGFDASGRGYIVWAGLAEPQSVYVSIRGDSGWSTGSLWSGVADSIDFTAQAAIDDVFLSYPRAVWHDVAKGDLVYAEQVSTSGWAVQTIDAPGQVGADPRLTADAEGRSWVVHLDRNELNLRGSRQGSESGWYSRILDSSGATGLWPDVTMGPVGDVRVLYFRADNRTLVVRTWGRYD